MFALLISTPRFKSTVVYQDNPKIKLFLQKNAKFSRVGAPPSDLQSRAAGGLAPRPPMACGGSPPDSQNSSPLRIFGYERLNLV